MKLTRTAAFFILVGLLIYAKFAWPTDSGLAVSPSMQGQVTAGVPVKANQVLQYVRSTGHAPDGYEGGRTFENREGRLPENGNYREFDVDPHNGQRNAERIIIEWNSKKAWYTGDHYRTFIPLP